MHDLKPNGEISRDEAVTRILFSIAKEETALSELISAEAAKIRYAVGALESTPPKPATIEEILKVNRSAEDTLEATIRKEMILTQKMTEALRASTMQGPTGPQGPKGDPGIEARFITADEYMALPEDEKRRPDIIWVIYPDNQN